MRKALIVGIDEYEEPYQLTCCVNDVNSIYDLLAFNSDGTRNFSIIKRINKEATYDQIMEDLDKVFSDDSDISLFYFSGHGFDDRNDGKICTIDYASNHMGIRFRDIIELIGQKKCKNKIIILDCCHSGKMGNFSIIGDQTILSHGTTILTACNANEYAVEINGHGIFTNLLIAALQGGAADIFGNVTPGSIYSYIDSSLGAFDQRPLFKSHVSSFVSLRRAHEKMTILEIRELISLFEHSEIKYKLDPSYEETNFPGSERIGKADLKKPYCTPENIKIFKLLQKATSNGLVKPSNEQHMFYAAMNFDTCELTMLGKHYWYMVNNELI